MTDHAEAAPTPPPTLPPALTSAPDRLAAALRITVGTLVRAARTGDRLAPIPAAVLDLLDRRGPMTTAELAASRGVRHQTMAATVKELIDTGYLSAVADTADARKKILTLTPAGTNAIGDDRKARTALLAEALAETLTEAEQLVLAEALPLLERVAQALAPAGPAQDGPSPAGPSRDGSAPDLPSPAGPERDGPSPDAPA